MTRKHEDPSSVFEIFFELFNDFSERAYEKLKKGKDFSQNSQIYHYTSLESLHKIIESQSFRATSIFMLNDPNELSHGNQHISNWFLDGINKNISSNTRYKSIFGFPAFVFSLSELNDDMHCWDKYGDKHKGIRIGFTPENIVRYWRKISSVQVILTPVVYHDHGHNFIGRYTEDFIDFQTTFTRKINNYISNNGLNDKNIDELSYCSSLISSLIKRKEWALEKEWRIVCIPRGHAHESIIGDFSDGVASAKLENKSEDSWALLTNRGHDGLAHKEVLKIGCLAGNLEFIQYTIQLIFKNHTEKNYFNEKISRSEIVIR